MTQKEKLQEIIKYIKTKKFDCKYLKNQLKWTTYCIFSHKFLKAFFGEKIKYPETVEVIDGFNETVQQREKMVIKSEFIKIFGKEGYRKIIVYGIMGLTLRTIKQFTFKKGIIIKSGASITKKQILKCFQLGVVTVYQKTIQKSGWQYHSQQLVILSDNKKIDYLYNFLEGKIK